MSKKNKKQEIEASKEQVVKMRFKENKFYNNPNEIHFEKDKIYEIKGAGLIQRWLKRGGEIVEGELEFPEAKVNPSELVKEEVKEEIKSEE
jgi:hypothetical protein